MLVYLILPESDTFLCSNNVQHCLNKQIVASSYLTFCIELLIRLFTKIQFRYIVRAALDTLIPGCVCVCVGCSDLGNSAT